MVLGVYAAIGAHGFSCRKGLSMAFAWLVYHHHIEHFPDKI
jgi:hypothetical protein